MDYKKGVASMVLAAALGSSACAGKVGNVESPTSSSEKREDNKKTGDGNRAENKGKVNGYDNVYGLSDEARDMVFNSVVKINKEYEYEVVIGETKTIGITESSASGVAIFDDESGDTYILTAGHVLPTKEKICLRTGFFTSECYKVLKKRMTVEGHPAEVVKHNETFDLGLIKLSGKFLAHHFTGKLAGDLEVGNKIVGAGYSFGEWKSFHLGYVIGEDVGEGLEDFAESEPEAKKELIRIKDTHDIFGAPRYVVLNTSLSPGDSGSPLYALKDGVPELAALVHLIYRYKEGQKGITPPQVLRGFVYGTDIADELGVYKR